MQARTSSPALSIGEGLALLAGCFVLLPLVGWPMQARLPPLVGIALAEAAVVLLPTLVALRLAGVPLGGGLGLRPQCANVHLLSIVGALLAGAGGGWLVAGGLEPLQERLFPSPPALREQLRWLIAPSGIARPLAPTLLALALAPAACEEALFRGALLRSLLPAGRTRAVLATALAFGLFHFSPYKLPATIALGALLGALAVRAGSLWAPLVAHATNNALVVLLVRAGRESPPSPRSPTGTLLLAGAAAAMALGLALARPAAARQR